MDAGSWKTVRIFVSSTFRDMHAERDHLVKVTFPAVRQWCAEHRLFLDEIDLRWGITRQEADEGKALEICLREVDEARPLFICLLGGRYGWVPTETPPSNRYMLPEMSTEDLLSITHLEVLHAALDPIPKWGGFKDSPAQQAFFYLREKESIPLPENVPAPQRGLFTKVYIEDSPTSVTKLAALKHDLEVKFLPQGRLRYYSGEWDPNAENPEIPGLVGRLGHLDRFGQFVEEDLRRGITEMFPDRFSGSSDLPSRRPLGEEEIHASFIRARLRAHVPRMVLENRLKAYIADPEERRPLLVTGQPGSGKSSLLAHWTNSLAGISGLRSVSRFIGASPASVNLPRLLADLAQHLGDGNSRPLNTKSLPEALRGWRRFLDTRRGEQYLFVLDGIDQLDDRASPERAAEWLPNPLPEGVKAVISVADASPERPGARWALALRRFDFLEMEVPGLTATECQAIIHEVPSLVCKSLSQDQVATLMENPSSRNPLFLRVVLDELRMFGSFEKLTEEIGSLPKGDGSSEFALDELFGRVLARMERDAARQATGLVPRLFGWLARAREGLTERELEGLIRDQFPNEDQRVVWQAVQVVLRQMRLYLLVKAHPGGLVWDFYHRSFWAASRKKYTIGQRIPSELAAYFSSQPTRLAGGGWNMRKIAELPRHQLDGALWDDFTKTTTEEEWVECCSESGLGDELAELFEEGHRRSRSDSPEAARRLIDATARAMVSADARGNLAFNIDSVHSWLFVLSDQAYYRELLETMVGGTPTRDAQTLSAASYLAEQLRRIPDLPAASALFSTIEPELTRRGMWKAASRVIYGRGYIRFLSACNESDLEEAGLLMESSVEPGKLAGDIVGAWIGKSLSFLFRHLACRLRGTADPAAYAASIQGALEVFEARAYGDSPDPRAERWVRNVLSQFHDLAWETRDASALAAWKHRIMTNPWELRYGDRNEHLLLDAREFVLTGDPKAGAECYQQHRQRVPGRWEMAMEGVSRLFLELGDALALAGDASGARQVLETALQARDDQGNFFWKYSARVALERTWHS